MPEPPENLTELLETLALIDDRQERIELLIEIAERFEPIAESIVPRPYPESSRVPGCESEAFIFTDPGESETLNYHYAVDNPQGISAMAMSVILDEACSGSPLDRVAAIPADVIYSIFGNELSMGKSMGLMGMVQMTTALAQKALKN